MMYETEPTFDDLALQAELTAIEDAALVRAHSPRFWDADHGELATSDPFEHPSWDVREALAEGWDDPAEAIDVLEQTVVDDSRLTPLADTAYGRREVHRVDELFLDTPLGEELLHEQALALVPLAADSAWDVDDTVWEVRAA